MKSWIARIILLSILLLGTAFMRLLGSEQGGQILCEKLEELVVEQVPGVSLHVGTCRIRPWEFEAFLSDVSFGLSEPVGVDLSVGHFSVQMLRPDLLLHRRLRLGKITISDMRLALDLTPLQNAEVDQEPTQDAPCAFNFMDWFRVEQFRLSNADITIALPDAKQIHLSDIVAFIHSGKKQHILKLSTGTGGVIFGDQDIPISEVKLAGGIDFSSGALSIAQAEISAGDILFSTRGTLSKLCEVPHASLITQLTTPLSVLNGVFPELDLNASGNASLHARVTGSLDSPAAEGDLTLKQAKLSDFTIGNLYLAGKLEEGLATIRKLTLSVGDGRIEGVGTIDVSQDDFPSNVSLNLSKVGFGRLVDMLTLHGAWPDFQAAGTVAVSGTLQPFHLNGKAALDLKNFKVFDRAWDEIGKEAMLELVPAKLNLNLNFTQEGVRMSQGTIVTQNSNLGVDCFLSFDVIRGLQLSVDIHTLDLGRDLKHIVGIPWSGIIEGKATISGPYEALDISGKITGTRMTFQDLDFGSVSMAPHFGGKDGSLLSFQDIRIQRGASRFLANGALDFRGKSPLGMGMATFENAQLSDLVGMLEKTHWIFDFLKDRGDATLSGTAQVNGELLKPESFVQARLSDFVYYGRQFGDVDFQFSTRDGEVISVDKFNTDGPVGQIWANGQILLSEGLEFHVIGPQLSLRELSLPQAESSKIFGTMDLKAKLFGPFDKVVLRSEAELTDVEVKGIKLGNGLLDIGMDDGVMWFLGPIGEALLAEGRMDTAGDMPFVADMKISTRKLQNYLPLDVEGLEGRFKAKAHVAGTVEDLDNLAGKLEVELLNLSKESLRIRASSPFYLTFNGKGAMKLPSLTLRGRDELRLNLSASVNESDELNGSVTGNFNARLLEFFTDAVEQLGGTMKADFTLAGTLSDPALVGNLTMKEVHGEMPAVSTAAENVEGTIYLAQNRIFIDDVRGSVNQGAMNLSGTVDIAKNYLPQNLDLSLSLEATAMTFPSWLPSTLSGSFHLKGPLGALMLSGDADISDVRYQKDIGIDPKSLISKMGQRAPAFMNIEEEKEWIKFDLNLHFGEDIWIQNNLVRAKIGGDVQLVGSNLNLGLLGTARAEEQGKAFFRGNEFELKRATVDFTDRKRLAGTLDVLGETELRDYRVYLRVLGSLDEPEVTLSSEPALEQADILMLLTLGFTTRETDMASSSVGIGLIGETLLNLSGLDKQVKRFLPKNALFKDFNIQLSTQYSEVSGTVEPIAQLESKILTDDLRLRFSQPVLSNKGRQVNLEYRFNEHVATQMQWNDENSGSSMGDLGVDLKLRWEFE